MRKSNIIFIIIFITVCIQQVIAQTAQNNDAIRQKIAYVPNIQKALELAKKEQKLIFVNCYANWAVPCQGMDKLVFTDNSFAEWMNKNFINLWLDVITTDEGREFAKKYDVRVFAHYLILDGDGKVVHRIIGGSKLPEFQERVARALNPKTQLAKQQKRYRDGDRTLDFLREYLISLYDSSGDFDVVENEFLNMLPISQRSKKENWRIISKQAYSVDDPMFLYIEENRESFIRENGKDVVNALLGGGFIYKFFSMATGSTPFVADSARSLNERASKIDLPNSHEIETLYNIARLRHYKKYDEMILILKSSSSHLSPRTHSAVDYSLSQIKSISPKEQEFILSYLKERAALPENKDLSGYKKAIAAIEGIGKGIAFEENTFTEALDKAKKENKLLFLDAYTSWCGPCKIMSSKVFTLPQVGDYFNRHFINVKVDMEKGEGIDLTKRYNVTAYPTMLLIDTDGNVRHKIVGAKSADELIRCAEEGLNEETSYQRIKQRYEDGDRTPGFLAQYYKMMKEVSELTDAQREISRFLEGLSLSERLQPTVWELFNANIDDPASNLIRDFFIHFDEYKYAIGVHPVDRKAATILLQEFERSFSDTNWSLLGQLIEGFNYKDEQATYQLYKLIDDYRTQNYSNILNRYTNIISKMSDSKARINLDSLLFTLLQQGDENIYKGAKKYAQAGLELQENKQMYERLIKQFSSNI